jgi:hypothetical protein
MFAVTHAAPDRLQISNSTKDVIRAATDAMYDQWCKRMHASDREA